MNYDLSPDGPPKPPRDAEMPLPGERDRRSDNIDIEDDVFCVHCGYNLRGLTKRHRCPECGTPAGFSVEGDLLKYAQIPWIRTVRDGLAMFVWSIGIHLVSIVNSWVMPDFGVLLDLLSAVLAIVGASGGDVEVHLVEVDQKKAAFLREAARVAEAPVTLHVQRIESLAPFPVDAVTARACAPLPRLLDYAAPFLRQYPPDAPPPVGLFLKGRDVDRELTEARKKWKMHAELVPSRSDAAGKILRIQLPHLGDNPL